MTDRMFSWITHTINPLAGGPCPYQCTYCWATDLKNRHKWEKYKGPWRIYEKELKTFKPGDSVFPFDMVDIGCPSIPAEMIHRFLKWMRDQPEVKFLLLTKNPEFYTIYLDWIPSNCVLGATIESDAWHYLNQISRAPNPLERMVEMIGLSDSFETFVCIEPIIRFTSLFANRLSYIEPKNIAIGYDNHKNKLPEPSLYETEKLISELEKFTTVHRKTIREAHDR